MTPDPWDLEVLVRTLHGEARGEGPDGLAAVVWVVLHRQHDALRRWPATTAAVCLQRDQFACWWQEGANRELTIAARSDSDAMIFCRVVARSVLAGDLPDPTLGANHYLAADLAERDPPSWFDPTKVTARIGRHLFLKL